MKLATQADRFLRRAANDDRFLPSHISLYMAMFYYSSAEKPGGHFQVGRKKLDAIFTHQVDSHLP